MHRIAISGACGRMGQRIAALVQETNDLKVAAAIERPDHPQQGKPYGSCCGLSPRR